MSLLKPVSEKNAKGKVKKIFAEIKNEKQEAREQKCLEKQQAEEISYLKSAEKEKEMIQ